jgi:hypothetical protein
MTPERWGRVAQSGWMDLTVLDMCTIGLRITRLPVRLGRSLGQRSAVRGDQRGRRADHATKGVILSSSSRCASS